MTMEFHEINDSAGRPHEEIGAEQKELEPIVACEHLNRRINLSTAMVACLDCGEDLLDLNPLLSDSLRVARNLP